MSYTYEDAQADAYYEKLYNELGPEWAEEHASELNTQAIHDFTNERLQSYYLKHPDMAGAALAMMGEMGGLIGGHRIAALLFATSAVEITIKHLLLKPILNGLVHNERVADLVMGLAPRETGSDGFKALLFGVLNKVAGVDLATYRRSGSNRTVWDEWKQLQKERNNLIHDGSAPSAETLAFFDSVATEFLNVIFPKVLRRLGLEVTGYLMIAVGSESLEDEKDSLE